jgi:hypothetical protein
MSIRHYSQNDMAQPAEASTATTRGRRTSAYDNCFGQHLIDHGIYPDRYDYPDSDITPEPSNLEEIQARLMAKRPSLSPSLFPDAAFRDFKRADGRVVTEGMVMSTVLPIIRGSADIPCAESLLFNGLDPLTDGTIVAAKPDFYDGSPLEVINIRIREDSGYLTVPSASNQRAPALPNFFTEAKTPNGAIDVARRQACYDGALGARAMQGMQSYAQDEPVFDNKAYTITSTYYDGTLKIFAVHLTLSTDNSTNHHMTPLRSFAMTDTAETFRQGASAYRNAREWAQEQRDTFIAIANKRAIQLDA